MSKIRNKKKKGFSLVELLVSIAIFTIVSITMSNMIINIAQFSRHNDLRNNFLNDLDFAMTRMKNSLRGASRIGACPPQGSQPTRLFYVDAAGETQILEVPNNGLGLFWARKTNNDPTDRCFNGNGNLSLTEILTPDQFQIRNVNPNPNNVSGLRVTSTQVGTNTIIYLYLEVCSSSSITVDSNRIFDCSDDLDDAAHNPYSYVMALSSRNIQAAP